jgi:hypothetical protein
VGNLALVAEAVSEELGIEVEPGPSDEAEKKVGLQGGHRGVEWEACCWRCGCCHCQETLLGQQELRFLRGQIDKLNGRTVINIIYIATKQV